MTPSDATEDDPPGTTSRAEPTPLESGALPADSVGSRSTAVAPPADVAPELHDGGDR